MELVTPREVRMAERGLCHFCKQYHGVLSVSDQQAKIIAEDAQDPADYYTMETHLHNSKECEGSGEPPESLAEDYSEGDDFFVDGDIDDEPSPSDLAAMPDRSGDGHELDIYGPKAHE